MGKEIICKLSTSNQKLNIYFMQLPLSCSSFQKNITSAKVVYYPKIYYHAKFLDPTLNTASVAPTSEVCMIVIFLLLTVRNKKY